MDKDEEEVAIKKETFFISGIVTSPSFQRCRFLAIKLYRSFPKLYEQPNIKPMFNVEWEEYLTKMKRTYGKKIWALKKQVTVFVNDSYLGDDTDFVNHLQQKYHFSLNLDLDKMGRCHLVEMLRNIMGKYRQIAYLTISINNQVIGSMMFELYNDLVPLASENFLERCKDMEDGYTGTPIHRIVKGGWIQCGGWNLTNKIMPCENYVIPHDRRGVLCTTNIGRHKENSTQFFITLAPAPWMDTKYVAFGQLLQGEEILRAIENVPTYYESPKYPIDIIMSGEVTLDGIPDYFTSTDHPGYQSIQPTDDMCYKDNYNMVPTTSRFSITKFRHGLYSLETDMRNYLTFPQLPDYLMPRIDKTGSEGSSTSTLDIGKFVTLDVQPLVLQDSVVDFSKTQNILKDCKMPTQSNTTL
ncbi:probable inactive peptidyl-prolyl cis-trans isomerase-like 6 [Diorhabda carinulata]|uniref:probable inactive peptidyl-prolyl cis-trans isomerase-like 6 n=1 Tax=Diorhabda carinulata TaxID=1163345 RepID=UPI0025A03D23|nr:probable inactive peptidyl-prolyl cis-trans isomerase-like 6 [Diorhabda carinulata]